MAIRLPVYEQHVQLDSGAHTIARIHADDATGKAISRIGESMIGVAAHWKAKEEQRDKYNYMDQLTVLNTELARIKYEVGQEYQPGIHPPNWMHEQIVLRSKPLIAGWVRNAPASQQERAVSHGKSLTVTTDIGAATANSQVDKAYYTKKLDGIVGGFTAALKANPDGFADAVKQYEETVKDTASLTGYEKETTRRGHLKKLLDAALEGLVKQGRVDEANKLNDDFTTKMDAEDKTQRGAPAVGGGTGPRSEGFNANRVAQIDSKPQIKDAIEKAADATGMDPNVLKTIASIESGGQAGARTGSYTGLFQLSSAEFQRGGGGNITDPYDNALAAAKVLSQHAAKFEQTNGRPPTASDLYLIHQQGEAGAAEHTKNPDQPAWRSMFATGEGQQKGESWAKKAIWGNIPDDLKRQFGNVENVTSRDFMALWKGKVEGRGASTTAAAPKTGGFTEEETGTRKIQTAAAAPATATDATAEEKPKIVKDPETGQLRQETSEEMSARTAGGATASNAPTPQTTGERPVVPAPAPKSFWSSTRDSNSILIDANQLKISSTDKMMKKALEGVMANDIRNIERFGTGAQMPPELQKYFKAPSGELTHEMIANKLGEAVAIQWEEDKLTAGRFHGVIADMDKMSRDAIIDRLDAAKPVEGSFDLIRQEKTEARARKYAQELMKQRNEDPAKAAEAFPAVQDLKDQLRKAQENQLENPSLAGEQKVTELQSQLAGLRMRAQTLLGVPAHLQSPITNDDAERIASVLLDRSSPNATKAADQVVKEIRAISGGNPEIERRAFEHILGVTGVVKEDQEAVANRLARANRAVGAPDQLQTDEMGRRTIKTKAQIDDENANLIAGGPGYDPSLGQIAPEELPTAAEAGAFVPGSKQLDSGHINELLNDPSVGGIFDRMYGKGASQYVLNDARSRGMPVGPRSDYADNPEFIPEVGPELPKETKDPYDPDNVNPLDAEEIPTPEL